MYIRIAIKNPLEKKLWELEDHAHAVFLYGLDITNFSLTNGCSRCHSINMHT